MSNHPTLKQDSIVLGGGCFWCIEAVYQRIPGVLKVASGYAGGEAPNPNYHQVCGGETGHAEVVRITYDPSEVSLEELLDVFWQAHDPTTPNQQGADVGTQYRSVIYTHSPEQLATAKKSLEKAQANFPGSIVTEISPLEHFYPAEDYHQNYYKDNRHVPYCLFVILPKLKKLEKDRVIPAD